MSLIKLKSVLSSLLAIFQVYCNYKMAHLWLWSYGSWIYNYLCNQFLSPLKLWVQISFMQRWTRYNFMW